MLIALALVMVFSTGAAWAHCGSCGVGDDTAAGMEEGHGHHGDGHHEGMAMTACPGCGMEGGLCAGCEPTAKGILSEIAAGFCPNCESADNLCEMCSTAVEGAMGDLANFGPMMVDAPNHKVIYVEGTLMGDMNALFGELMAVAGEQGLLSDHTQVGGYFPDALAVGFSPESKYYAGISFPEGATVSAPLKVAEIPGGSYLTVDHVGSYETLGETWMAAFAWAKIAGVEFGTGPCGEHYVSDPETTPENELVTKIFIPVAGMAEGHGA